MRQENAPAKMVWANHASFCQSSRNSTTHNYLSGVACGNNQFVAVGWNGKIVT